MMLWKVAHYSDILFSAVNLKMKKTCWGVLTNRNSTSVSIDIPSLTLCSE